MNYTLITGATGGLGKAFCFESARLNYNLIITATKQEKLNQLKLELLKEFPNIEIKCFQCDLSNLSNIDIMLNQINEDKTIVVERLIENAGIDYEGPILDRTPQELQKVIDINVKSTIYLFNKFLMLRNEKEIFSTLIVSSMAGFYSMPQKAIYSASKCMLTNFFTSMHIELQNQNVKITIVAPGGIPTTQEMLDSIASQGLGGKLSSESPENIAKNSLKALNKNKLIYIPRFFNNFLRVIAFPFSKSFQAKQINKRWLKTRAIVEKEKEKEKIKKK